MAGLLGLFGSGARNSPASYLPAPQDPNNPIPRALLIGAMLQDVGNNLRGSGATDNQMQARMLGYQLQQRAMLMKAQQAIARAAAGLPMQEDSDGSPAPQAAPQPPPQPAPQAPDPSLTAPDPNADASVPPPDPGPALTSQVGQDLGASGGLTPDAQLARYRIAAPQAPAIPPPPVVAPPPQAPTQQSLVQSRSPRRPVTMRDMAPAIANMALIPGSEDLVKNDIALFSAADPKVTFDRRGYGNDQYGNPVGGFHPEISADRAPLYDQAGHIVGEQNLIGAPEATAAMAQAKAEAEARTAAKYDLIPVPMSDGSTRMMPRLTARAVLTGQGGPGGAGTTGGSPTGQPAAAVTGPALGASQTPADKALAEEQAKLQANRTMAQPKALATNLDSDRVADFSRNTIHDILGETQDPKTGAWVKTKPSQVNWKTTGIMGSLDDVPGTPAHDLRAKLDTILAQTAVTELQKMRDESPTGGALGRVTQQEIEMLAAMRGSILQTQSGPQLEASLRHHLNQLDQIAAIRNRLYAEQYPNGQQPAAPAQAPANSRAALIAEARRRGLIH